MIENEEDHYATKVSRSDGELTSANSSVVEPESIPASGAQVQLAKLDEASAKHNIVLVSPNEIEGSYELGGWTCAVMTAELITPEHLDLTKRMLKFLADIDANGLAAPQIGIKQRFFVYWDNRTNQAHVCYNPQYYKASAYVRLLERCLSYGDLRFYLERPKEVQAVWYEWDNTKLVKKTKRLKGLNAEIFQHETDHLDGITIATKGVLIQ